MDFVSRAFRNTKATAFTLGVSTVVLTHSAMIIGYLPGSWSETQKANHASINLAAAAAIVYGSGLLG